MHRESSPLVIWRNSSCLILTNLYRRRRYFAFLRGPPISTVSGNRSRFHKRSLWSRPGTAFSGYCGYLQRHGGAWLHYKEGFEEYGISFFQGSVKRRVLHNPAIVFTSSLLDVLQSGWVYEDVFLVCGVTEFLSHLRGGWGRTGELRHPLPVKRQPLEEGPGVREERIMEEKSAYKLNECRKALAEITGALRKRWLLPAQSYDRCPERILNRGGSGNRSALVWSWKKRESQPPGWKWQHFAERSGF